jgi:hypothetical protein
MLLVVPLISHNVPAPALAVPDDEGSLDIFPPFPLRFSSLFLVK